MKRIDRTHLGAFIVLGALLFSSCKKEISPAAPPNEPASTAMSVSTCKPVVLGATVQFPGGPVNWVTLMQKWYGGNGKPAYLNANFFTDMNTMDHLDHSIQWGELLQGNNDQLYLRNGSDTMMRVTLDVQGRPAASYYRHNHFPKGSFLIDTSYFYYSGDKLDMIVRLYVDSYGGSSRFAKYRFFYDGSGNLVTIEKWDPNFNFTYMNMNYDYGQPVAGMVPLQQVSIPYKLLEYMDLLQFPIHHKLTQVSGFGNNFEYINYAQLGNGLVSTYAAAGAYSRIFYTGWQCSSASFNPDVMNRQRNDLKSLADFNQLYPQ